MWLTTIRYIQATERDTCVSRQAVHAFSRERERRTLDTNSRYKARALFYATRKCGTSLVTKAARAALRKASVSFQLSDDHDERADYHAWFQLRFFEWIHGNFTTATLNFSKSHYYGLETVKWFGEEGMMILNHELKLKYTMRVKFAYLYLIIISIIHNSMIVFKNFRGLVGTTACSNTVENYEIISILEYLIFVPKILSFNPLIFQGKDPL